MFLKTIRWLQPWNLDQMCRKNPETDLEGAWGPVHESWPLMTEMLWELHEMPNELLRKYDTSILWLSPIGAPSNWAEDGWMWVIQGAINLILSRAAESSVMSSHFCSLILRPSDWLSWSSEIKSSILPPSEPLSKYQMLSLDFNLLARPIAK